MDGFRRCKKVMPSRSQHRPIYGGCLCGSVRYEASGEPYNIVHCHCLDCRRSSGAPLVTWASFRQREFRFTSGKARVISWAGRLRSFCPKCGTPLAFRTRADAEEIDVTVASFDDPERVVPVAHIWLEDRLSWIKTADGLPTHERKRLAGEKSRKKRARKRS
jgi:hypothetical protein